MGRGEEVLRDKNEELWLKRALFVLFLKVLSVTKKKKRKEEETVAETVNSYYEKTKTRNCGGNGEEANVDEKL